jgi:hypothetical protein
MYEICERKDEPGVWSVENSDYDGGCWVTNFYGPDSKERAEEYLAFKNAQLAKAAE